MTLIHIIHGATPLTEDADKDTFTKSESTSKGQASSGKNYATINSTLIAYIYTNIHIYYLSISTYLQMFKNVVATSHSPNLINPD